MNPSIDIAVEHDAWAAHVGPIEPLIERAVAVACAECRLDIVPDAELSVVLCDDAFIRDLNRRWRGKDQATNVLSFPAAASAPPTLLGDIIVAYETSALEAAERGIDLAEHLTHLVVHGTLHLFGFDHHDEEEAETMEAMESRTLAALGIASPYKDVEDLRATS